jgi:hypothetical protein
MGELAGMAGLHYVALQGPFGIQGFPGALSHSAVSLFGNGLGSTHSQASLPAVTRHLAVLARFKVISSDR